jgi:hypothetical protein
MLDGAFALLERSLRIDLRSRMPHLIRLGFLVAIYLALFSALLTGGAFGAPGLRFFGMMAFLDLIFLTLMGIGFFSAVITEEKEEDTLGLMLMAGVRPLGVLAGKSLGGFWQAILLIVVQYPFILLATTLGGVTSGQVFAAMIALLAYIILMTGFGLLCSTVSSNSRNAAWLMGAGIIVYFVLASIADTLVKYRILAGLSGGQMGISSDFTGNLLKGFSGSCLFNHLDTILSTGFNESALSIQVVSNVAAGIIFAGLSWLLFGIATRSPSTEANSRGLLARHRGFFLFTAGQVWSNPFLWKDFYFVSGGTGMMLARIAYFGALGLIPFLVENTFPSQAGGYWYVFALIGFSASISAANVLARSMYDEVHGQTLASLMMLPRPSIGIVYSKFAGALLGWLPGPLLGPITLVTSYELWEEFGYMTTRANWPANQLLMIVLVLSFYGMFFVLIPHFATLLALYVRWGAVPLAIGFAICVYVAVGMVIAMIQINWTRSSGEIGITVALIVLTCLCIACHIVILLRVQALAAK